MQLRRRVWVEAFVVEDITWNVLPFPYACYITLFYLFVTLGALTKRTYF